MSPRRRAGHSRTTGAGTSLPGPVRQERAPAVVGTQPDASLREGPGVVEGGLESHYRYMRGLQDWARRFLGKRSIRKHAGVVADHSVFCRRTPFPHVALAEAQWNPDLDTKATVDDILSFLSMREAVERTPEPERPAPDPGGKPPWLWDQAPSGGTETVAREGHTE